MSCTSLLVTSKALRSAYYQNLGQFTNIFCCFFQSDLKDMKKTYSTAYFIFVRDALSYLVLLGLHFAICLEPSCLSFSRLEWTVLIFLLGRLMVEGRQIVDKARSERQRARDTLKKNIGYLSFNFNLENFIHNSAAFVELECYK